MPIVEQNKKLIINADDFGLHYSINQAIECAHKEGVLTSASLIVNGEAFGNAVEIAKSNKNLGVGLHLNLIAEEPVAAAEQVAAITSPTGKLYEDHQRLCIKILSKRHLLKQITAETEAQVAKFYNSGLVPTHIDSHRHLHLFPPIFNVIQEVLGKYGISRVRYLNIPWGEFPRGTFFRKAMALFFKYYSFLNRNKYRHADRFLGFFDSGHLDKQYFINLVKNLKAGVTEINLHPGRSNQEIRVKYSFWDDYFPWRFDWENEFRLLLDKDLKEIIKTSGIALINYSQV